MTTLPQAQPEAVSLYVELAPSSLDGNGARIGSLLRDYLGVLAHYLASQADTAVDALQQAIVNLPALGLVAGTHLERQVQTATVDHQALQELLELLLRATVPAADATGLANTLADCVLRVARNPRQALPALRISVAIIGTGCLTSQLGALQCQFSLQEQPATQGWPSLSKPAVQVQVTADWAAYALQDDELDKADAFITDMRAQGSLDDIGRSAAFLRFSSP
ncbi:hypothetical protein V2S84_17950 [Azotobacter chroococcum]|nr:hypothetical protein [Azotobacter chroococcum]